MTINELYRESLKQLKSPEVDEINIRTLICFINGYKTMSDFYLHKNENIKDLHEFYSYFARFLNGEPIQYITNCSHFYGHEFYVDNRVLIPRQETEEVVDFAIKKAEKIFGKKSITIADICCGSGCIGVSLGLTLNNSKIYFSDISKDALEVTKINCSRHKINGIYYECDSIESLINNKHKIDLLVSNPPYILNRKDVDESVKKYEPQIALYADEKLSVYTKIIKNLNQLKNHSLLAVFEIGYDIKDKLENIIKTEYPKCEYEFIKDINGKYRILSIYLK